MKAYIKPEFEIFSAQIDSYCATTTVSYEIEMPSEGGTGGSASGGLQEGSVKDDL